MPAGPPTPPAEPRQPPWSDWSSYRRFVLEECIRLGAPRPEDSQLRFRYVEQRAEMARIAAWGEVYRWEEEQAARDDGGRPRRGVRSR